MIPFAPEQTIMKPSNPRKVLMNPRPTQIWLARILIGLVFFFNVQCALVFLASPLIMPPASNWLGQPARAWCAAWVCCF